MRSTSRRLASLAVLALLGVGCSKAPAGSSSDVGTTAGHDQALQFSTCMRAHGVSAFPDPKPSGDLTIDEVANGSSLDTNAPAFKQALDACKDLEPPGFTGTKRNAQQQQAALEFAQCMRDNGVKDFPDPTPDGALIDTNRIPSAAGRGARDIPGFDAAAHTCGAKYGGQLGLPSR